MYVQGQADQPVEGAAGPGRQGRQGGEGKHPHAQSFQMSKIFGEHKTYNRLRSKKVAINLQI